MLLLPAFCICVRQGLLSESACSFAAPTSSFCVLALPYPGPKGLPNYLSCPAVRRLLYCSGREDQISCSDARAGGLFAVQRSQAFWFKSWGVSPSALVGKSPCAIQARSPCACTRGSFICCCLIPWMSRLPSSRRFVSYLCIAPKEITLRADEKELLAGESSRQGPCVSPS